MLTAKQARNMANTDVIDLSRFKELEDITSSIKTNAIYGITSINRYKISPYVKKYLRNLGYTVWVYENSVTISWKKTFLQKVKELFGLILLIF